MSVPTPVRSQLRGIVLLVLSASFFAAVDGLSKLLAETQPVSQIVWARYAISLPILIATTVPRNWRSLFRTSRPLHQLVRALMPLGVSVTMVLAVHYLPLAEATVILFAGPFLIVALSAPVLGERVHPTSWIGVAVGFAAVVLVARPGFGHLSEYVVFPAVAAVLFAVFQLTTRWLRSIGESAPTTLAWTLATGAVVVTPFAIANWPETDLRAWLLMIGLGVVFGLAQGLMVRAFAHGNASTLAPFGYAQIVAAVAFGMLVFGEIPDVITLLGVSILIAAGVYVARSQAV